MPRHLASTLLQGCESRGHFSTWSHISYVFPASSALRFRRVCQQGPNTNLCWFWAQTSVIKLSVWILSATSGR